MHSDAAESSKSGAAADNATPQSGDEFLKSLGKKMLENWNTPIAAPMMNSTSQNIQNSKPSVPESKLPVPTAGNPRITITSAKQDDNDNDSDDDGRPAPQRPLSILVPSLQAEPENVGQPRNSGLVKPSSDSIETIDTIMARSLFGFVRGESPCLWYKFKRFESLSLLNLYHLQDELVTLDEKIGKGSGEVTRGQVLELRGLLKEYRKGELSASSWR